MNPKRRLRRFEELCHLRKRQEDMKAQVYANAVRNVHLAEDAKSRLEQRRTVIFAEAAVTEGSVIDSEQQRRLYQYERHLARSIVEQDSLIQERQGVASEKHVDMVESVKLRKMMETLSNRSREEVLHEFKRQERYGLDEVASVQSAMKRKP